MFDNFKFSEERIRKFWEKEKIYKFDFKKKGKVYSIDTPPPTVSGKIHIGHAFSYSQQDFIARFQRMYLAEKGQVFYPFGTDDNGLPTERLVEKIKGVKSKEMSRADFIKICLKTLKEITPDFIQDWKDIGISSDFDVFYSTIDVNSRKISQQSFSELYKKGEVYEKEFPTIWCPECQTSIAQAELEDKELQSQFSVIKFEAGGKDLPIATTRPELISACVAVFVHPEDKKYKSFIGKKAKVPLFNFEVPIIADKSANPEKGTGALMVCSYGDKYDVDDVQRHKLKPKIILNRNGTLDVRDYKGLKIKDARKKILKDLEEKGFVIEKKQIFHVVNVHDKCGTEIEFIPTKQWFVKIMDKKKKLIEQGRKVKWHPEYMRKRYENWINGLDWDWNISRDRHFGIPIPVWRCEKCKEVIFPKEKELPIDPFEIKRKCLKCNEYAAPESKVLDTWATSSLTPQITSSLVKNMVKIQYSLRPNGHDIIRTWAFYTIVKSYLHENKIPWRYIVISGMVSLKGEKMSKSKGNVIEPQKVLGEFGADALRFWAAGSKLGEDMDYQEKELVTGKKFVNKLRNAAKFVFMNLKDYKGQKPKKLEKIDEYFLKDLNRLVYIVTDYFQKYEYSRVKFNVEDFFWRNFCDDYLETVKKRIYNEKGDKKISAQYTLYNSLLTILKLLAPIMPFVTEEIYQEHFKKTEKNKSIHVSVWPKFYDMHKGKWQWDEEDWRELGWVNRWYVYRDTLSKIRSKKTQNKKSMNSEIILTLDKKTYNALKEFLEDLKNVTNAKEIKEGEFKVEFV